MVYAKLMRYATFGLLGLLSVEGALPARAGVAVSPLKQEISLRPGEEGTLTLTLSNVVRNELGAPQGLRVEVADVKISEQGALQLPPAGSQADSASKWIALPAADMNLGAGKSEVLQLKVTPPLNAAPGEYYAAILVTLATKGQTEGGVMVQYRVASGVFVTVLGQSLPKHARITRCQVEWPATATTEPATQPANPDEGPRIVAVLQNTGKARFNVGGKVAVFDANGRLVWRTSLTSPRPSVFAGDSRVFEAPLNRALAPGRYTAKVEMDYESPWSTARQVLPIEITPAQSGVLAAAHQRVRAGSGLLEIGPETLSSVSYPGSTRSVALTLRNTSDDALHGTAAVCAGTGTLPASWVTIGSEEFSLPRSGRRALEVRIAPPADALPGKYAGALLVEAGVEGGAAGSMKSHVVPVELEIRSGKR